MKKSALLSLVLLACISFGLVGLAHSVLAIPKAEWFNRELTGLTASPQPPDRSEINPLELDLLAKSTKPSPTRRPRSSPTPGELRPFAEVVKNTRKFEGLFTLYRKPQSNILYLEVQPQQLNQNFLCTITLDSGIGEAGLYSGLPIGDALFYFQRVNNSLQFTIRNVNFRARPGEPQSQLLPRSFSDSVLFTLPIQAIEPKRKSFLVEVDDIFLKDFANLTTMVSAVLDGSYSIDSKGSSFGELQVFPLNINLETIYNFTGKDAKVVALPDNRAFTLRVRYGLSQLPDNRSYRPRLADDRVGYFVTAYKDLSNDRQRDNFIRYINRWNLQKQNPQAALSPPKQPIVFWIENTVPSQYREAIRDGILMWNPAFEAIGFQDAIVVKQMPDRATWNPADVRYNTIRWFNAFDAIFALGPSRANPLTGEILDADILISADFVRFVRQEFRIFQELGQNRSGQLIEELLANGQLCTEKFFRLPSSQLVQPPLSQRAQPLSQLMQKYDFCYGQQAAQYLADGALEMAFQAQPATDSEMQVYLQQFLRMLVAHEVGHALGLRHNFVGSTMLSPDQLNDRTITQTKGLSASVMDYLPPNIAPTRQQQGDYFSQVLGPYDRWAIAYGYMPIEAATPIQELPKLQEIAGRAVEPDLAYATDEDAFAFLDPQINLFDLSNDILSYNQKKLDQAVNIWQRLNKRYPIRGESYNEMRRVFDSVFFKYLSQAADLVPYVGGQYFQRTLGGEGSGRIPFTVVPLERQRQALEVLQKYVFDDRSFQFSPDLLNKLPPSRWTHWGNRSFFSRLDYPIRDNILFMQTLVLSDLLASDRMTRILDNELKAQAGQTLTLAELLTTVQNGIWREVIQPNSDNVEISSLRRALQRQYLNLLTSLALRQSSLNTAQTLPEALIALRTLAAPEDARTLAWYSLRQLGDRLDGILRQSHISDLTTRAHLEESRERVRKVLAAQLQAR